MAPESRNGGIKKGWPLVGNGELNHVSASTKIDALQQAAEKASLPRWKV
jgi:hypothetical protein